jgi:uncharacterized protein YndB with AHSA1/START domain
MATNPELGYLLIADLTGYTAYLSRSELEHAPVIAGDLLETIVGRLEPPFRLAKLEGDAAFLFVEDGRADGPLLVDAIEAAYLAFRRRLRSIEAATACTCQACGLAPRLDLKLFLHHGAFVRSPIAGREELAGSSVILVHRLLKGPTAEAAHDTSGRARGFALITDDAIRALGVAPGSLDASATGETIDPFGEVTLHRIDLEARWQAEQGRRRIEIAPEAAAIDLRIEVAMPPADVWANLTSPALRSTWEGAIVTLEDRDGPRGVGARARCVTGRLATIEEIVDWQPYDHIGYRVAVPGLGSIDAAYDLESTAVGTAIRLRWALPPGTAVDPATIERIRAERVGALGRLVERSAIETEPETLEMLT